MEDNRLQPKRKVEVFADAISIPALFSDDFHGKTIIMIYKLTNVLFPFTTFKELLDTIALK